MAALLSGIGLARFAYSPLLPMVIRAGWFSPEAAAYLGAANLLGYLAGALSARWLARHLGQRVVLRGGMLAVTASLAACCLPQPFFTFFLWRLASGIIGGVLMILGPSAALSVVSPERRGLASGFVVTGVGLGIAASGTLVPILMRWGLTQAWLGLAAASLVLAVAAWSGWPAAPPVAVAARRAGRFAAICASYGLCAVGLSPHMVFLVDYVARGLGRGLGAGSAIWVVFGLGALIGPVTMGRLSDRAGADTAFRVVMAVEATAAGLLLFSEAPAVLGLSALLGGMVVSGVTAVMLGRVGLRAGGDPASRQRGWTLATVLWAIGQAAGTYGMAWLYGRTGYPALFMAALVAMGLAAVVEAGFVVGWRRTAVTG